MSDSVADSLAVCRKLASDSCCALPVLKESSLMVRFHTGVEIGYYSNSSVLPYTQRALMAAS